MEVDHVQPLAPGRRVVRPGETFKAFATPATRPRLKGSLRSDRTDRVTRISGPNY